MFGIVLQPASILEHMFDMEDFACSLGIKVVESSKARFGYFCCDTGTIVVPTGVPARLRRSMIAHELGHAVYELNVTPSLIIAWHEQFSETRCQ